MVIDQSFKDGWTKMPETVGDVPPPPPVPRAPRSGAWLALVCIIAIAGLTLAVASENPGERGVNFVLLPILMGVAVGNYPARKLRNAIAAVGALVALFLVSEVLQDTSESLVTRGLFCLPFVVYPIALLRLHGYLMKRYARAYGSGPVARLLTEDEARSYKTFGRPAASGDRGVREKSGNAKYNGGVVGEIKTATALDDVLKFAGVRFFHSLPVPGTSNVDIDHALVCGARVAFIDSKNWRGGHYSADRYGNLLRDGVPFEGGDVKTASAVQAWRNALPANAVVEGFIVIHSSNNKPITVQLETRVDGVKVLTGEDGHGDAGAYSTMLKFLGPEAGKLDREVLSAILLRTESRLLVRPAPTKKVIHDHLPW